MKLIIPAVPVAQPRQRHRVVKGYAVNYTPDSHPVQAYKATVRLAAHEAGVRTVMEGPIALDVDFYLPRPKRLMRRKDPDGPVRHTGRPDADNLWKSTVDSLGGLVWRDDSQICDSHMRKWYVEKDGIPRVEITVREENDTQYQRGVSRCV